MAPPISLDPNAEIEALMDHLNALDAVTGWGAIVALTVENYYSAPTHTSSRVPTSSTGPKAVQAVVLLAKAGRVSKLVRLAP